MTGLVNSIYSIVNYPLILRPKCLFHIASAFRYSPFNFLAATWQGLAHSLCQAVLIVMANTFLAIRLVVACTDGGRQLDRAPIPSIHGLTQSRLQSGLVMGFSGTAFTVGVVSVVTKWAKNP